MEGHVGVKSVRPHDTPHQNWPRRVPCWFPRSSPFSSPFSGGSKNHAQREVMMFFEFGAALANNTQVPFSEMDETVETHYQVSLKTAKGQDGGNQSPVSQFRPVFGR